MRASVHGAYVATNHATSPPAADLIWLLHFAGPIVVNIAFESNDCKLCFYHLIHYKKACTLLREDLKVSLSFFRTDLHLWPQRQSAARHERCPSAVREPWLPSRIQVHVHSIRRILLPISDRSEYKNEENYVNRMQLYIIRQFRRNCTHQRRAESRLPGGKGSRNVRSIRATVLFQPPVWRMQVCFCHPCRVIVCFVRSRFCSNLVGNNMSLFLQCYWSNVRFRFVIFCGLLHNTFRISNRIN